MHGESTLHKHFGQVFFDVFKQLSPSTRRIKLNILDIMIGSVKWSLNRNKINKMQQYRPQNKKMNLMLKQRLNTQGAVIPKQDF